MLKKILFNSKCSRLENTEPFILPDTLSFDIENPCYDLSQSFITLRNGEVQDTFKFTRPFIVPDNFLFAGRLEAKITAYHNGEIVKSWALFPIKIIEADGNIIAFDEINALNKEIIELKENVATKLNIAELTEKINELIEKQNALADTVSELKENY